MDSTERPAKKPNPWGPRLAGLVLLAVLAVLGTCGYPFFKAEWNYRDTKEEYSRRSTQYDAIVQQLALWLPNDTRLYWLLAELLNADGQYKEAEKIMDECVGESRKYDSVELKEHRRILKSYTPPPPPAPPGV